MINLEKGQRVNVELQKFTIGLGWDTNSSNTGVDFDLDASAFILGENKKLLSDDFFVFYINLLTVQLNTQATILQVREMAMTKASA